MVSSQDLDLGAALDQHYNQRYGLVIGVNAYDEANTLENCINDAELICERMKAIGFRAEACLNGKRDEIEQRLEALYAKVNSSVDVFLYFCGHGIQVNGVNYFVPADGSINDEATFADTMIDVTRWIDRISRKSGIAIVFLDTCRNDPFKIFKDAAQDGIRRGMFMPKQGLASIEAQNGAFIAFACGPGLTASDGSGVNSPFSKAVAEEMTIEGLSLEMVGARVTKKVLHETNNDQRPWRSSSLDGDYSLCPMHIEHLVTTSKDVVLLSYYSRHGQDIDARTIAERRLETIEAKLRPRLYEEGHLKRLIAT